MRNKQNNPEKDLEDIFKKSYLLEPSADMEDRIMQKIHAAGSKYAVNSGINKWLPFMVYSILATIFVYFLFMPSNSQNTPKINTIFNLNRFQIIDPEIFNLGPIQPYLIMSIIVFAVAIWLIILFNLPKNNSIRKFV